jgi:hypothetical protein
VLCLTAAVSCFVLLVLYKLSTRIDNSLRAIALEIKSIDEEIASKDHEKSRKLIKDLNLARQSRKSRQQQVIPMTVLPNRKRRTFLSLPESTWDAPIQKGGVGKKTDSAGERETRSAIENIFKTPFPKSRPNFLYNPVTSNRVLDPMDEDVGSKKRDAGAQRWPGSNDPFAEGADDDENGAYLELDCFSKKLLVACEFSGIQHYKFNEFFHGSLSGFHEQRYRDDMKKSLCLKFGVKLIVVPYTIKQDAIRSYIIEQAKKLRLLDDDFS